MSGHYVMFIPIPSCYKFTQLKRRHETATGKSLSEEEFFDVLLSIYWDYRFKIERRAV